MAFTKEQKKVYSKQYYLDHKEKLQQQSRTYYAHLSTEEKIKRRQKNYPRIKHWRQKRIAVVRRIKQRIGCRMCGVKNPVVLVFHHRDSGTKRFSISEGIDRYSWETIKREMRKCDILCANCHLITHDKLVPWSNGYDIALSRRR